MRTRIFLRRSQKVVIPSAKRQIIVPFKTVSLFLIFTLLAAVIYLIFRSDIFIIKKMKITGDNGQFCQPVAQIKEKLEVVGSSIVFVDLKKLAKKITGDFPCIGEVKSRKIFPETLEFEIVTRKPVLQAIATTSAQPVVATQSAVFIVDDQGFTFAKIQATVSALPLAFFPMATNLTVGQRLDSKEVRFAVEISKFFENAKLKLKILSFAAKEILAQTESDTIILFSTEKDLGQSLASLQSILQRAKIEGKNFSKIDLRFEKPVVE